jgi:hypothetical protein
MLAEKHRPKSMAEVVGQEKAVKILTAQLKQDRGAIWIEGNPGTGKTSLALAFANQILNGAPKVGSLYVWNGVEFDKSACDQVDRELMYHPWGPARIFLINEASEIKSYARAWLLSRMETIPSRNWFLFTSMYPLLKKSPQGEFLFDATESQALSSRMINIKLNEQGLAPVFAAHAQRIAQAEGLDGQPIERYVKLAKDCRNNLREMLARIEAGAMIE